MSTGSPASRRPTKLTPLTTRPAVTSRQGMMRLANTSECRHQLVGARLAGGEVEIAGVDRPAADDALDAVAEHGAQAVDVRQVGQTAGRDDRDGQCLGQLDGGLDVDAGEHAVAADVGVDDALDAVVLELLRKVDHLVAGQLAPAVGRDLAVLGVQADDDVAAEGAAGVLQEAGVLDRGGADDHVAQAVVQVALDGVEVTDAAAELDRDLVADLLDDGLDGWLVHRLAGEGAVQVHQMQAARPCIEPAPGHGGGILAEGGRVVHVALLEADAATVFEVDGGDQQHGRGLNQNKGWRAWCLTEWPPWRRLCRATRGAPWRGLAKPVGGGVVLRASSEGNCGRAQGPTRHFSRGEIGSQKYYPGPLHR
mmetsp:Transcript_6310/g.25573  ORF Transcript_6310/g.25573 Transcript_6310/m.25573 type:complete len:366 (-) Transcript_6310:1389-2486(-)